MAGIRSGAFWPRAEEGQPLAQIAWDRASDLAAAQGEACGGRVKAKDRYDQNAQNNYELVLRSPWRKSELRR